MTENRYLRIQELIFDSFLFNSPVEIEKGALLLDNKTKSIILQLRLNILGKGSPEISSVSVKIIGLDDAGEEIQGFNPFIYTYRDVYLLISRTFGDRVPIILDPKVRQVKVGLDKVIFKDGNVWIKNVEECFPPEQQLIETLDTDLIGQLSRDTLDISVESKEQIKYLPQQLDNYWLCVCGRPNLKSVEECDRCGKDKKWVFETVDEIRIKKNLGTYLENERQLKEEKRIRDDLKKSRTKKATFIFLGVGLFLFLFLYLALPFIKYTQASKSLNKKDYDKAIVLFGSLADFRDSQDMVSEANYQKAKDLSTVKEFKEAIEIFSELGNYKDSKDQVLFIKYNNAKEYFAGEEYENAILFLSDLGSYKDSEILLKEARYLLATQCANNGKIEKSIQLFEKLDTYKDSYEQEKYLMAKEKIKVNRLDEAISLLEEIKNYKDANEILQVSKYSIAKDYYRYGDFMLAKEIFEEIENFQDSKKFIGLVNALISIQGTWKYNNNIIVFVGWKYYEVYDFYIDGSSENFTAENRLFDHNISENSITFEKYYFDEKFKYVVGSNYIEKVVNGWERYKFMKISDDVVSPDVLRIVSSEK